MYRLTKIVIILSCFVVSLSADYESGKKLFEQKCSSCHSGYIPSKILKKNFYEMDNKILHLKAPTVNMIAYSLKDSPMHIGEPDDPEMQKMEIGEFLQEYLYTPDISNSVCDSVISKHYDKKESMKGEVSEDEILQITDYLFEYKSKRKKTNPKERRELNSIDDIPLLLSEAKQEDKTIIIEAMSKTCHYCKAMEKAVFSKKEIQEKLDKDFIFIRVDIDEMKLPFGLDKGFKGFTPSFYMINSEGKLTNKYPGSWTKEDFIEILDENR